jgi:O-Antigen ligase
MPSHLRPLPLILAAALVLYWLASSAFPQAARSGDLRRWCTAFMLVSTLAFASPSLWVYASAMMLVVGIFLALPGERAERAAVFWALLLMAVPNVGAYIPGFGGIGNFFEMQHSRALTLSLMLPAAVMLPRDPRRPGPFGVVTDWFVAGYIMVQVLVVLPYATRTDVIRQAFVQLIDTGLPYWVFSRAIASREGLRRVMLAYVLTAMVLAMLSLIESVKRWPLYDAVPEAWRIDWDLTIFLERAGFLRAKASAGHSLVFGFVLVLAIGFWSAIKTDVPRRWLVTLGSLGLAAGLLASLARGSWLGAIVLVVLRTLLDRRGIRNLVLLGGVAVIAGFIAAQVPAMQGFVDMLPFVGTVDSDNVTYRQRLLEISLDLIAHSPWLGVPGYLNYMEELRQGQGIIDIVNSYVGIMLNTGVIGLAAYLGIFASMLLPLWRLRGMAAQEPEGARFAASLAATTLALLFVIVTTSSIVVIPQLLHMLVGLGVSCARLYLPRQAGMPLAQPAVSPRL